MSFSLSKTTNTDLYAQGASGLAMYIQLAPSTLLPWIPAILALPKPLREFAMFALPKDQKVNTNVPASSKKANLDTPMRISPSFVVHINPIPGTQLPSLPPSPLYSKTRNGSSHVCNFLNGLNYFIMSLAASCVIVVDGTPYQISERNSLVSCVCALTKQIPHVVMSLPLFAGFFATLTIWARLVIRNRFQP